MTTEKILALANPMLYAVLAAAFLVMWRRQPARTWIGLVGLTYLASAAGFTIFHLSGNPNGVVPITLMHLFYSVSCITMVWGICLRSDLKPQLKTYIGIAVVGLAMLAIASWSKDYNARLYAANATYGLIFALGCQTAARKPVKDVLDKTLIFLLGMTTFQFFTRPLAAIIVEGAMTAEQYRETPFYAVMVIWLAVGSLLLAMTLLIAALTDQIKSVRDDAGRDALTGLKMRGPFEEEAVGMLGRSRTEESPVSVVVADIDHFKTVNDTFGHQTGDHAIAAFGRVIAKQIRDCDIAGRIGGEEFCIVAWNCDAGAAQAMAERIRRALSDVKVQGMPDSIRLTASFGVAEHHGGEGYGKVFARADSALYRAKNGGRDCVRIDGKADNVAVLSAQASRKMLRA